MNIIGAHILSLIILLPLLGAAAIACIPERYKIEIRIISLSISIGVLILAINLFTLFKATGEFQFQEVLPWIPSVGIYYRLGIDGTSLIMILLTAILVPASIAISWFEIDKKVKSFHALILILETGMLGTFAALDVFLFYVFWELVLIPMYFVIGVWGSGKRIRSAIKFVIFTALGSLIMLVGILYCANAVGGGFALASWYTHSFAPKTQIILFAAFALAFAIKLPVIPLHTWLPDAHTDAPTAGSVLLAGVLLKMGAYGFYRFAMPLFPIAVAYYTPTFLILAVIAIIYGGLIAMVQPDMKRLIAYSSIAHMGFVVLGLFALDPNAIEGAVLQMFNHGITTGALFMMIGMLYGRTRTRIIADYGGAARPMPLLAVFFIFFAIASAGLPGLSTFVGEFMVMLGSFQTRTYYALVAIPGLIIAAVYMIWLIQRLFFGPGRGVANSNPEDLGVREYLIAVPMIAIIVAIGVWPKPWLAKIDKSAQNFLALSTRGMVMEEKIEEPSPMRLKPPSEIESQTLIETETQYEVEVKTKSPDATELRYEKQGGTGTDVETKVTLPPLPAGLEEEQ